MTDLLWAAFGWTMLFVTALCFQLEPTDDRLFRFCRRIALVLLGLAAVLLSWRFLR